MADTADYEDGMIDLGKSVSASAMPGVSPEKTKPITKLDYPSLYIADVPELDELPDGEFYFLCRGQVTRHTEENPIKGSDEDTGDRKGGSAGKGCSCEITVMAMKPMGDAKPSPSRAMPDNQPTLDSALTKIALDKAEADEGE
jgi:hypothetical protein